MMDGRKWRAARESAIHAQDDAAAHQARCCRNNFNFGVLGMLYTADRLTELPLTSVENVRDVEALGQPQGLQRPALRRYVANT
jgi:hypothetical protein